MLPHLRKKKDDEEEPFVSVEQEMAKAYIATHPEADPDYYTPAVLQKSAEVPAHKMPNPELETAEEQPNDAEDSE